MRVVWETGIHLLDGLLHHLFELADEGGRIGLDPGHLAEFGKVACEGFIVNQLFPIVVAFTMLDIQIAGLEFVADREQHGQFECKQQNALTLFRTTDNFF